MDKCWKCGKANFVQNTDYYLECVECGSLTEIREKRREQPFKSKNRRTVYSYAKHITEVGLLKKEIAARDKIIGGQRETIKEDMLYASDLNREINNLKQDLAITKRERDTAQSCVELSEDKAKCLNGVINTLCKSEERLNKIIDAIIKE